MVTVNSHFSMEELIKETIFNGNTGALNSADIIMARGASTYVDWDNPEEVEKVKHLLICKNHEDELLREWASKKYNHIKYIKGENGEDIPTCYTLEELNIPAEETVHLEV